MDGKTGRGLHALVEREREEDRHAVFSARGTIVIE
jgi:hypothetical protein